MSLTEMIEHYYPKESWEDLINESRFKKALEMQELRAQKNEALSLIECTQFADKGTIIEKSIELRQRLKFPSRRKCKSFFNNAQNLRNNIAHAQREIYNDVGSLIRLLADIHNVVELAFSEIHQ